MKNTIVLVGGGGHCRSVIDAIEEQGLFQIAGIVDTPDKIGTQVLGYSIFACDDNIPRLVKEYSNFCITIGHIKTNELRKNLYIKLKKLGAKFPVIKSPHAYVSKSAIIKEGTVILHKSVINAKAILGECCIANTACIIEHDVIIKDHCHIGPGAIVNGGCLVEDNCFVASNSVLLPGVSIRQNSLIAAGSVIISDVGENSMYAGNPAILKKKYNG
jgi:sugar O-acyltransferase (sialic acid O-acetyltransferase NeuD family)